MSSNITQVGFNQLINASDLEKTIVKSGLLCFGPFNTKIGRVLFKHRVLDALAKKKKIFKTTKNDDTCANVEFEVRRFPESIEIASSDWRREVAETMDAYINMNEKIREQKTDALDNLKLQSKVYREEILSLKRQIDVLKREKEALSEELMPQVEKVRRRRSLYY